MSIKILQVVGGFSIDYSGGVTNYVRNLSNGLNSMGKITSFTLDSQRDKGKIRYEQNKEEKKITIYNSPLNSFSLTNVYLELNNVQTETLFKEILEKIKPDIVHFHLLLDFSMEFISIAKKFGSKVVITIHDYWFICPKIQLIDSNNQVCNDFKNGEKCYNCIMSSYGKEEEGFRKIAKKTYKKIVSKNKREHFLSRFKKSKKVLAEADLVIGVSNFVSKMIKEFSADTNIKTLHIGTITAEDDFYKVDNDSNDLLNEISFAFLGNFNYFKGAEVILNALEDLGEKNEKMKFSIYGRVSKEYYDKVINHNFIKYKGEYNYSNLPDIMNNIDVLVVPPIWYDNAPQVVMEALAANIPVIGSDIGGIPDFVKDGVNGYLFKAGNYHELSNIINKILSSPDEIKSLRSGSSYVKKLSTHIEEMEAMYIDLYKEVNEYA